MAARVTQTTVRTLTSGDPEARVSQVTARTLTRGTAEARTTQLTVRVLSVNDDVPAGPLRRRPVYLVT